eukprot:3606566-Pyramimonas_sp.AAC.2
MDTSDLQRVEVGQVEGSKAPIFGSSRSPWSRVDPKSSTIPRGGATHQGTLETYNGNILMSGES